MKKLRLTILAIVASIFANNASAADPDDLQKLKDTNKCVGCDLFVANLKGAILMKLTLTALTLAATMFASSASAFDPDDLQKLKDTNECVECDLSSADLWGAYLMNANLKDADLWGADLSKADLSKANLKGADLSGANLRDAYLYYAIMNSVILCNTTMPDGSVTYSGC